MRANNIPSANGAGQPGQTNGLLSQLLGNYQPPPAPNEETEQPMQGVQETIEQQIESRREQLQQLHAMGLMDDLQNIQVHFSVNIDVFRSISMVFILVFVSFHDQ
jgi:hypothetical protein